MRIVWLVDLFGHGLNTDLRREEDFFNSLKILHLLCMFHVNRVSDLGVVYHVYLALVTVFNYLLLA
jgi:hypothetical protein